MKDSRIVLTAGMGSLEMPSSIAAAEWLPGNADNLLADIANGRPVAMPNGASPHNWRDFTDRAIEACRRGAALTLGLRRQSSLPYWVYWPFGVPTGRPVALLSSRIGRDLTQWHAWFAAFRGAMRQADPLREIIVTVAGTTTYAFVRRAATLFDIPMMTVLPARRAQPITTWLSERLANTQDRNDGHVAHVSPYLGQAESLEDIPLQDVLLADTAQRLVVLHARAGGAVDRVVHRALADSSRPAGCVEICEGDRLISPQLRSAYLTEGAVAWSPPPAEPPATPDTSELTDSRPVTGVERPAAVIALRRFTEIAKALAWAGESILSHCTRRCYGAWPGESQEKYLDQLILRGPTDDRSLFGTLSRIVRRRCIVGTAGMYRGGYRAVSFAQVPLEQLLQMRTFRNHRAAWDYEPYGICTTLTALQALGARPVYYGGEELWNLLGDENRPYFQKRYSNGANGQPIDWSIEREWRIIGDVSLDDLPADQVWLFVPTEAEAKKIATISPWSVVACD